MTSKKSEMDVRSPGRVRFATTKTSIPIGTSAEPSRIRGSPIMLRASSASPPASRYTSLVPLYTTRDAIHRDIRQEVTRRGYGRTEDNSKTSKSSVYESYGRPGTSTGFRASTSKVNEENKEKYVPSYTSTKPDWMLELQRRKAEKMKTIPITLPSKSDNDATPTSPPAFRSVLDQIKSMGKDNLFASLRKTSIQIRTGSPEMTMNTSTNVSFPSIKQNSSSESSSDLLLHINGDDIITTLKSRTSSPRSSTLLSSSPSPVLDDHFEYQMISNKSSKSLSPNQVSQRNGRQSHIITITSEFQTMNGSNETILHKVVFENTPSGNSNPKVTTGSQSNYSTSPKRPESNENTNANKEIFSVKELLNICPKNLTSSKSKQVTYNLESIATESDELKSPYLLRTLMSSLSKSKAMYSSDTELNFHSCEDQSGLLPGSKFSASKRSMLSLTNLSHLTTVPYYMLAPTSPLTSKYGSVRTRYDRNIGTSGFISKATDTKGANKKLMDTTNDLIDLHLTDTYKYEFQPERMNSGQPDGQLLDKRWLKEGRGWRQQNGACILEVQKKESAVVMGSSDLHVKVDDQNQLNVTSKSEQKLTLT